MIEQNENRVDAERLLKRILDADAEARKLTAEAVSDRAEMARQITEETSEMRKAYEAETEAMLTRIRDSANKTADSRFAEIQAEQKKKLDQLNALAESKTAAWVEQVYAAILRG